MNTFEMLAASLQEAKNKYSEALGKEKKDTLSVSDIFFSDSRNILARADNLDFASYLLKEKKAKETVDFIYIDPPFFTGSSQNAKIRVSGASKNPSVLSSKAYSDSASSGIAFYLAELGARLLAAKDLLKETGVIAVHLDWHAVHYVKVLMDDIFGADRFINELIWSYKSGGFGSKGFAKKHDTILIYSKSKKYYFSPQKEKSYNRGYRPYRFKGVKEYEDELGWYTLVNRRDVISTDMVGRSSPERTGYATQKPLKLISIITESFCPPEGVCADLYAGSGSLAVAAAASSRSFYCCDSSPAAVSVSAKRLALSGFAFTLLESKDTAPCSLSAEYSRVQVLTDELILSLEKAERDISELGLKGKALTAFMKALGSNPIALADFAAEGIQTEEGFMVKRIFIPSAGGTRLEVSISPDSAAIKLWDKFGGCCVNDLI